MSNLKTNYLLHKIVIIGDTSVGKSSFIGSYMNNGTYDRYLSPTIGAKYFTKYFTIDNIKRKLEIWDTAGEERFKSLARIYYRNANGIILMYDVSRRETFNSLDKWISDIKNCCDDSVSVIIIGNKTDLDRDVSFDEGMDYAKNHGFLYSESSVITYTNINESIIQLINIISNINIINNNILFNITNNIN